MTRRILAALAALMLTPIFMSAQSKLDAVIRDIENDNNVEVIYVENRNPATKKIESKSNTYTLKKGQYNNKIINAFKAERENATKVVFNPKRLYRLDFVDGNLTHTYLYIIDSGTLIVKTEPQKVVKRYNLGDLKKLAPDSIYVTRKTIGSI